MVHFLAMYQICKILWHFEFYGKFNNWQFEIMINEILRMANRRRKLDSTGIVCVGSRIFFMSDWLRSVWGHWVCFAKFPMLRF